MASQLRILITGATGLLGRSLLPAIQGTNEVFSVGRSNGEKSATPISVDFNDSWSAGSLPESIDVVIHLAQSAAYRDFPRSANEVFKVNLESTARLLDYAYSSGAKRFILASTGGIYRPDSSPLTEDSELLGPDQLGYYFASKLASEMLAGTYRPYFDVHVFRIFFMYGRNQRPEMFVPGLINRIETGLPITLNGPDGIHVNPVHADDVAAAMAQIARSGGPKTINAAGPDVLSIRAISEIIGKIVGREPVVVEEGVRPDLVANVGDFRNLVGRELIPFSDGIFSLLPLKDGS